MKKFKGIVIGVLITVIISSVVAYASPSMIEVMFNNIKIKVNGNEIKSDTEPFIYQNRTYVPLRAVAENMGADVYWDNTTNTVSIQDSSDEKISDYSVSVYLLGTSTRLTEISESLFYCRTILLYEPRGSEVYNTYYEIFKMDRELFNDMKSGYTNTANLISKNSTCSENIEAANKLLNTLTLLEENINLLSDLYVSYDAEKDIQFANNHFAIRENNAYTRSIIYKFVGK